MTKRVIYIINTVLVIVLFSFTRPASASFTITSRDSQTNVINCGNGYSVVADTGRDDYWLKISKNSILITNEVKTLPFTFKSQCSQDEGNYEILIYKLDQNKSAAEFAGSLNLTIIGNTESPILTIRNLTNSSRILNVFTEDYLKLEVKKGTPNKPVEVCRSNGGSARCAFVSSYTTKDGAWESTFQIWPNISLGGWETWLKINGKESNHVPYTILTKPAEASYNASCYLVQERPRADVFIGDTVSWTVMSRPAGYKSFWYGLKNNVLVHNGQPIGLATNFKITSESFDINDIGHQTRWVQMRAKDGSFVCNTNEISFEIRPPSETPKTISSLPARPRYSLMSLISGYFRKLLKTN